MFVEIVCLITLAFVCIFQFIYLRVFVLGFVALLFPVRLLNLLLPILTPPPSQSPPPYISPHILS